MTDPALPGADGSTPPRSRFRLPTAWRSVGQQTGWSVLSVAATGLTTLVPPLALQSIGGASVTGAFSLAMIASTIALTVQRAVLTQTTQRGVAMASVPGLRKVVVGCIFGAAAGTAALTLAFGLSPAFWVLVAAAPCMLVQDLARYVFFGRLHPRRAAVGDVTWFLVMVAGLVLASALGALTVPAVLVAYGAGAAVAVGVMLARSLPAPTAASVPVPSLPSLVIESLVLSGIGSLAQPLVAATQPLSALGYARLAQTVCSVPSAALTAIQALIIPRIDMTDRRHIRRATWYLTLVLALGLAVVVVPALLFTPLRDMLQLPAGGVFEATLLITAVGVLLSAPVTALLWRARLVVRARQWLPVRVTSSVVELGAATGAGTAVGAPGLAVGAAVNNGVALVWLIALLRRHDRRAAAGGSDEGATSTENADTADTVAGRPEERER